MGIVVSGLEYNLTVLRPIIMVVAQLPGGESFLASANGVFAFFRQ